MKTDKFETNIRRKLDSISPDFEEKNWDAMQQYMQAQSPPSLWQQYKGWSAYAAAASVFLLTALLYAGQLQKNRQLVKAVAGLEQEMNQIKSGGLLTAIPDTVYIVQKEYVPIEDYRSNSQQPSPTPPPTRQKVADQLATVAQPNEPNLIALVPKAQEDRPHDETIILDEKTTETAILAVERTPMDQFPHPIATETYAYPSAAVSIPESDFRMEYALKSRMTPTRVRNSLAQLQTDNINRHNIAGQEKSINPTFQQESRKSLAELKARETSSKANTEQIAKKEANTPAKDEQVIPTLPLKAPYRFGLGYGWEGSSQVKSVVAEVQVAKRFSITTGLSWLKAKPLEFFNEKMFKEKNRSDFKKDHYDKVPQALEVVNIRVEPTMVQIPLTLAFRSNLSKDLDYYVMGGTQLTVSAKDRFDYDMLTPGSGYSEDYYQRGFTKNKKLPLFNSLNVGMGIEKSWNPVVVQIEGYYFHYSSPMSPSSNKAGPGLRVKLLYHIGKDA